MRPPEPQDHGLVVSITSCDAYFRFQESLSPTPHGKHFWQTFYWERPSLKKAHLHSNECSVSFLLDWGFSSPPRHRVPVHRIVRSWQDLECNAQTDTRNHRQPFRPWKPHRVSRGLLPMNLHSLVMNSNLQRQATFLRSADRTEGVKSKQRVVPRQKLWVRGFLENFFKITFF